jgi:acyl carrier protein
MSVLRRVQATVAREFKLPEGLVQPNAHLVDDLGACSINIVSLLLALEDEFGIEFPFQAVNRMNTPAELAELIATRIDLML